MARPLPFAVSAHRIGILRVRILVATVGHSGDDDRIYYKEIVSLLEAGHQVALMTRGQPAFEPGITNFEHFDSGAVGLRRFGVALADLGTRWQPDVLVIHEFELLLAGSRLKKAQRIPLIYDVHEPHQELWETFSTKPAPIKKMVNWGLDRFEKSFLTHVDHVLATSDTIAERYRGRGLLTTLIPNFPRLFSLAKIEVSNRQPSVIYQGQLSVERGIANLIQAFAPIPKRSPGARLEIIGPERLPGIIESLRSLAGRLGLAKAVTIRTAMSHPEVLARMMQVQVGVIPFTDLPLFKAAVPVKLFEYMLCGCAVVASDLPPIRRYAGDAALWVPPGDVEALHAALFRLLSDESHRTDLAVRGRDLIEKGYNWQAVEPDFLSVFEALQ